MPGFRLCLSIGGEDSKKIQTKLREADRLGADLIELRVDHLRNIDIEVLKDEVSPYLDRCILTCRPREEGGEFQGSEGERVSILESLIELSPAYIDLELATVKAEEHLVHKAREGGVSAIISWHSFEETPEAHTLRMKASDTLEFGQIGKIVTTAKSLWDNVRVLRLYQRFDEGKLVAFAMGQIGVVSRVLAPLLGSPLMYVSLPREAVAPGQLTIEEFRGFLDVLRAQD